MPLSAQYYIGQRQEGAYRDPIENTMKREGPDSRESEEGDRDSAPLRSTKRRRRRRQTAEMRLTAIGLRARRRRT